MRTKATTHTTRVTVRIRVIKDSNLQSVILPSPAHQYSLPESDQDELFVGFLGSLADFEVVFGLGYDWAPFRLGLGLVGGVVSWERLDRICVLKPTLLYIREHERHFGLVP